MKPYTWRSAILKSNLKPTTRHVLLTLSCYINDVGQSAYPSIKVLASNTGLTERAVGNNLRSARDIGWLRVGKHGFSGQRWANNEYFPQIPGDDEYDETENEGTERSSSPSKKVRNVETEGKERRSKGKERSDKKVRNDVPTNNPDELTKELSKEQSKKGKGAGAPIFSAINVLSDLGVDDQTANDWLSIRKDKRAKVTQTAIDGIVAEAGKANLPVAEVLKMCCARGWAGFQASWVSGDRRQNDLGHNPDRRGQPYKTTSDKQREFLNKLTGGGNDDIIDI